MTHFECEVKEINPLTEFVNQVILQPKTEISFIAGQYIELVLSENDKRPFSIANTPLNKRLIELQIGAAEQDNYTSAAMEHLRNNKTVTLKGPSGKAGLRYDSHSPIILLAGGTGFSYVKSIAETLLAENLHQPVFLYWGLRNEDAAYQLNEWQNKQNEHFKFIPVIENPSSDWQGRQGNVIDAVLADFTSLHDYQIYCAGRFEMVGKARKAFLEQGLQKDKMFADAFAFMDLD